MRARDGRGLDLLARRRLGEGQGVGHVVPAGHRIEVEPVERAEHLDVVDVAAEPRRGEDEVERPELRERRSQRGDQVVLPSHAREELGGRSVAAVRRLGEGEVDDVGDAEGLRRALVLGSAQREVVDLGGDPLVRLARQREAAGGGHAGGERGHQRHPVARGGQGGERRARRERRVVEVRAQREDVGRSRCGAARKRQPSTRSGIVQPSSVAVPARRSYTAAICAATADHE